MMSQGGTVAEMLASRKQRTYASAQALVKLQRYEAEKTEALKKCAKLKRELIAKRMQALARDSMMNFSGLAGEQYETICKVCYKALGKFHGLNLGATHEDVAGDVILLLLEESHVPAKSVQSLVYRLINRALRAYVSARTIRTVTWGEGKQHSTYSPIEVDLEFSGQVEKVSRGQSELVDRVWNAGKV